MAQITVNTTSGQKKRLAARCTKPLSAGSRSSVVHAALAAGLAAPPPPQTPPYPPNQLPADLRAHRAHHALGQRFDEARMVSAPRAVRAHEDVTQPTGYCTGDAATLLSGGWRLRTCRLARRR